MDFTDRSRENYRSQAPHHTRQAQPQTTTTDEAKTPTKRKRNFRSLISKWWKTALIIILLIGAAFLAYGYIHTRSQLTKLKNPAAANQNTAQALIDKIGKLVTLPTGETPTIATVNDASKLKNQPFFAAAQNGDKVLIYTKAGKAVLYRPSTNRVIEYSQVNLGNQ